MCAGLQRSSVEHDSGSGRQSLAVHSSWNQPGQRDVPVLYHVATPGDRVRVTVGDFWYFVDRDVEPVKLGVPALVDRFEGAQYDRVEPLRTAARSGQGRREQQSPNTASTPVPAPAQPRTG
jgi:hypothetical protein